jgi:hypothetical protein
MGFSARSSSVPKIAGSTSRQSARAASLSSCSWRASSGSAVDAAKSSPLKRGICVRRITEKPPASIVRQRCSIIGGKLATSWRRSASSCVKERLGSRPTSSANIVKRQRIRKWATSSAGWLASRERASAASWPAIVRVTRALRCAGSRLSGSVHTVASKART